MAEASGHNKEMEYFVTSKVLMAIIENRQLKCVDNSADSVYYTACEKPGKGSLWQVMKYLSKSKNTYPSHGNV